MQGCLRRRGSLPRWSRYYILLIATKDDFTVVIIDNDFIVKSIFKCQLTWYDLGNEGPDDGDGDIGENGDGPEVTDEPDEPGGENGGAVDEFGNLIVTMQSDAKGKSWYIFDY